MAPHPRPRVRVSALLSRLRTLRSGTLPSPRDWTHHLLLAGKLFLTAHLFVSYVAYIGPTDGISMVPTIPHSFRSHPFILESRLHRRGRNVQVGDVITFTHPVNLVYASCKRVIGMPGDIVSVVTPGRDDGDLGKADEEGEWAHVKEEMVRVPEGHCWVAGDNLEWSRDSRIFGAVPLALVRGKVLGVVWPWSAMKWFRTGLADAGGDDKEWVSG